MSRFQSARGVMPTYSGFLATWMNNLMTIYATGNIGQFWKTLKMFIYALPEDIKAGLLRRCETIDQTLQDQLRKFAENNMGKHLISHKQREFANAYLQEKAPEVWSEMQKRLDQKGLKLITGSGLFDPSGGKKSGKNRTEHKGFPGIMESGVRSEE